MPSAVRAFLYCATCAWNSATVTPSPFTVTAIGSGVAVGGAGVAVGSVGVGVARGAKIELQPVMMISRAAIDGDTYRPNGRRVPTLYKRPAGFKRSLIKRERVPPSSGGFPRSR